MTDKKYEKACKAYAEKHTEVPMLTVTIVMTPNQAREAIAIGGFDLESFFRGKDAVCIRSNAQVKADLEDAAAFGVHVMLDCICEAEVEAGTPDNDNEKPSGNTSSGEQG